MISGELRKTPFYIIFSIFIVVLKSLFFIFWVTIGGTRFFCLFVFKFFLFVFLLVFCYFICLFKCYMRCSKWAPAILKHDTSLRFMFSSTLWRMSWGRFWQTSKIFAWRWARLRIGSLKQSFLDTPIPHKQKSRGFKSGDLGDHSTGPPRQIPTVGKVFIHPVQQLDWKWSDNT